MANHANDPSTRPRDAFEAAVAEIFQSVLARAPSPSESTDWAAKLSRGVPASALIAHLKDSPERPVMPEAHDAAQTERATELFDAIWYRHRYPDIDAAGIDPLAHYAEHGWLEDRAPNPWFDPAWYRGQQDIPAGQNPLLHYRTVGETAGHRPSRWFDPDWYRVTYGIAAGRSPLADFLRRRRDGRVAPGPEMWPALGLTDRTLTPTEDDVFLTLGDTPADRLILAESGLFDENYYALHSGDVLDSGTDLLEHYCAFGWREGRQPNFYFDSAWYTATNPEVAALGVNPLAHYFLVGEPEGRRPVVFFDPVWYAGAYDVPDEMSPLAHFLRHRREGTFAPNEFFDPVWYSQQKGERPRAGRDPFARFLLLGLTEDASPSEKFDLAAYRRKSMGRASRHFRHLLDPARDNPLVHFLLTTYR
jgi:hypothetical protein